MFLRRLLSDAERPRHPPRSRSPSPPRVKRIEMKDMPEPSEEARAASRSASYSAAYQPGPDSDMLKDRLSRAVSENVNFQPALPMPEEGVVGFDELRERNERRQLGYKNTGLPIARLSFVGMPSPPNSRPVSQNMTGAGYYGSKTPQNYSGQVSESEEGSLDLSIHTTATSMASENSPTSHKAAIRKRAGSVVRRSGVYGGAPRRSRSAGPASVVSSRVPKRRVLTIQVCHPPSPAKSRLSKVYSPAEPTHSGRTLSRYGRRQRGAPLTITEEEFSQLQAENEQSNAALSATLEELDIAKTELARMKRRARQELRLAARERMFVVEDLSDTRNELAALQEDFELLEEDANREHSTATQLQKRLKKQTNALETLQKQVTERGEAIKTLEVDAAEKDKMMAEVTAAHDQLKKLQGELDSQRQKLAIAEDPEHSNTINGMKAAALIQVVASLQLQNKALTISRDSADESKSHAERMLASHKARTADQQTKIAELEAATSILNATVLRLETAITNSAKELGSTWQSKSALETELATIKAELETTKEKMAALPSKEEEATAEEKMAKDATTAVELETQISVLTSALSSEQATADRLRNELETLAEEAAKKNVALMAEIESAKATLATMASEKNEVQVKLESVIAEADQLNVKVFNINDARNQAQAEVERITQEKAAVEKQLAAEVNDKNAKLEADADADAEKAHKGDCSVQITILTQANQSLEVQRDNLEAQLAESHARIAHLEYEWINANGQIQTLQAELSMMTTHAALLESEEIHYKVQIESLSDRLVKDRSRKEHRHHMSMSSSSSSSSSTKKTTLKAAKNEELIIVRNSGQDKGSISSRKDCSARHRAHRSRSPRRSSNRDD